MSKANQMTDTTAATAFEDGDFDSILERSADEIQPPAKAPSGPWILRCTGTYIRKTSREDREANPEAPIGQVMFYHTPYEPLEGVDPELVEAGDWRGKKIVTKRNIKEPGDDFKALELARQHGVDTTGRSLKEVLTLCKGRMVQGTVSVYTYTRNKGKANEETVVENQIGNFAPVA